MVPEVQLYFPLLYWYVSGFGLASLKQAVISYTRGYILCVGPKGAKQ
jgi:hypothetical protein